jgi:hypothetical protein
MKTLLSFLFILVLTTAAILLDSHRLDAGVLFLALAVAVLFAFALNDRPLRNQPPPIVRLARSCSIQSEEWAERKVCVLCDGAASLGGELT